MGHENTNNNGISKQLLDLYKRVSQAHSLHEKQKLVDQARREQVELLANYTSNSALMCDANREARKHPMGVRAESIQQGDHVFVYSMQDQVYHLKRTDKGLVIEGHKFYCPKPVATEVLGSAYGVEELRTNFIGIGMCMRYTSPKVSDIDNGMRDTSDIERIEHYNAEGELKELSQWQ